MIPALYIFALMVAVGAMLYVFDLHSRKPEEKQKMTEKPSADTACSDDCCSANEVCPSEMMLSGANSAPVYFDDEELDRFRGRAADGYTADEEEQFRDVLYTLLPSDLMPWEQSVKKRGIILPKAIREEFIMLYSERTQKNRQQKPR